MDICDINKTGGQHQSMLSFRNIGQVFPGDFRALDNVSFSVNAGEFCVILGASGSGKTTLLRTVNGLINPSEGEIEIDGSIVTKKTLQQIQKKVSMIHQQFNLVNRLNVAQNVLSGASANVNFMRALFQWYPEELRQKACELISSVGLEKLHLYRRASLLSGGQQQRVGIARAFLLDPKIILADEPVASLDPKISRDVLSLLKGAAKERGATVLCSLHQLDYAREFADRIVAMKSGHVVFDGAPHSLDEKTVRHIYNDTQNMDAVVAA